jgi:hypothetical protein
MDHDLETTQDMIEMLIFEINSAELIGLEKQALKFEALLKCYQHHLKSLLK